MDNSGIKQDKKQIWQNTHFYEQFMNSQSMDNTRYFHLHLVSDSTGETLTAISRAASVQYSLTSAIEHVHPLVRTTRQLDRVLQNIEENPGIVLYTMVSRELSQVLEERCVELNIPCIPVLKHVMEVFESYLGPLPNKPVVGAQHELNTEYFKRIEAMNFTMTHDDGNLPTQLNKADIIIVGISRTSKTPTSIYLANRGYKTANVPLVPEIPIPTILDNNPNETFVIGLIATATRISEIRKNRLDNLTNETDQLSDYVNIERIEKEILYTRRLCSKNNWKIIDVTRKSIEETAASIIQIYKKAKEQGDRI